ncbi:hypothetical protein VP01_1651g2 [Puccinia sorghi]|uniref:Uncharacterized protein n=1 Tax=Puccinia sorghi TaxID=27349 RepID=A0A0L6VGL1_9BASI|nr:hypothetical protein VP01_1651g2 [Puccinia sorghi]
MPSQDLPAASVDLPATFLLPLNSDELLVWGQFIGDNRLATNNDPNPPLTPTIPLHLEYPLMAISSPAARYQLFVAIGLSTTGVGRNYTGNTHIARGLESPIGGKASSRSHLTRDCNSPFVAALQQIASGATKSLNTSAGVLAGRSLTSVEIIHWVQQIGKRRDKHDDWPHRGWYED